MILFNRLTWSTNPCFRCASGTRWGASRLTREEKSCWTLWWKFAWFQGWNSLVWTTLVSYRASHLKWRKKHRHDVLTENGSFCARTRVVPSHWLPQFKPTDNVVLNCCGMLRIMCIYRCEFALVFQRCTYDVYLCTTLAATLSGVLTLSLPRVIKFKFLLQLHL